METAQNFTKQLRLRLFLGLFSTSIIFIGVWWLAEEQFDLNTQATAGVLVIVALLIAVLAALIFTLYITKPIQAIWQAVLHVSPDAAGVAAPDLSNLRLGRELTTTLITHVYQIANVAQAVEKTAASNKHNLSSEFVANSLPVPIVVLNKNKDIVFANNSMLKYVEVEQLTGQNMDTALDMSFSDENTLDDWLERVRANSIVDAYTWERVKLSVGDQKATRLFDLMAYYNKNNPENYEIILTMFDRTRQYAQDDQAMSFIALAVHELRTPLTLLRGYIDAFEEELEGKLNPELTEFMHKMEAASQQLATFMTNVLNVARFENNELILKLHSEQWAPLLKNAVNDMQLRAKVRGITLNVEVDDNLPPVGVDSVSIYEVIANLIDNAIKYSKPDQEIMIRSHLTTDGLVETTVQDFGAGIPENATNNLFEKFYRDYRNRKQVGGTGMGLYLCKAIVKAHSGSIWVRSKEGQGSTFGFTLMPYSQLAENAPTEENGSDITRTAHGWIKNHSMYRR